jgi:hypothetical protein
MSARLVYCFLKTFKKFTPNIFWEFSRSHLASKAGKKVVFTSARLALNKNLYLHIRMAVLLLLVVSGIGLRNAVHSAAG